MNIVYLAGGMKSGWQEIVKSKIPTNDYKDPTTHDYSDPKRYTDWDLNAIDLCDIVFAYLEKHNPGGYALSFELGYAKAQGKTIILVDEKSEQDRNHKDRFEMIREAADFLFSKLDDGVHKLNELT